MNNIQKSFMLTGLIIFSSLIIFSTPKNNIFAVEYETYRSDTYGIAFQYPIGWEVEEDRTAYDFQDEEEDRTAFKSSIAGEYDDYPSITNAYGEIKVIDRNPIKNDDRYMYIHIYSGVQGQNLQSFTTNNMRKELEFYEKAGWTTDIKKEPTPIKIGNLQMGMYILNSKDLEGGDDEIAKRWTTLNGNKGYAFEFSTQKKEFNSPENTEIRDHFIESIKFRHVNVENACMILLQC